MILKAFLEREAWYRKNGIPFRRGYLLHGSSGNGKSTATRAMLSSRGLTAFTLRLFDPHSEEADLEHMFDQALKERPAMILFEDLDRAFPKTGECKSRISLQALLNALDGVGTVEGIVVVATAKEPTLLDPAILKRPGRFDRLVHFADPDPELRFEYIAKLRPDLNREALDPVVQTSDGFSFAQLREAYVIAGHAALGRKGDIEVEDLLLGVETLRGTMAGLANAHAGGFR